VALSRQFREQGLEVVAVDLGESRGAVEAFARRMAIAFPVLLDETGRSSVAFGLWGHPSTVLIDRAGRVVGLVRGERDWKSEPAVRLVRWLLDERGPGAQ
jgi:peroxiredoxin